MTRRPRDSRYAAAAASATAPADRRDPGVGACRGSGGLEEWGAMDGKEQDLTPALYVVATPIGNREDVTARAVSVLRAAAAVACEDTRHSRPFLEGLGVAAPLIPLHEHNERQAVARVIALIGEGKAVALVSDAGTPGISDPGGRAVAAVRAAGLPVVPIPGPSALTAALAVSGLPDGPALFAGFLPSRPHARQQEIRRLGAVPAALVIYEAPHRIEETLADLASLLEADRTLLVARELTKVFEEIAAMPLTEAPGWLAADPNRRRGEFVLVVSAPPPRTGLDAGAERVLRLLLAELPVKQAAKLAAEITGHGKNEFYARALELKADGERPDRR